MIGFDIKQGLPDEGLVAQGSVDPEFLRASFQDGRDIAPGRARNVYF
jgi:hypothetical protein